MKVKYDMVNVIAQSSISGDEANNADIEVEEPKRYR
jgi:hypothetical protein